MRSWWAIKRGQGKVKGKEPARPEEPKTRAELAESRIAQIENRVGQIETRVEQIATTLREVVQKQDELRQRISKRHLHKHPLHGIAGPELPLDQLSSRQRQVLQLIAAGHNTKQIGAIIRISPKTVEYHRMKLMQCLNVYDIPGLVRLALRAGLISHE